MFKELNPLLHSELRLAVMCIRDRPSGDVVAYWCRRGRLCLYPATDGSNGGQPQRAD